MKILPNPFGGVNTHLWRNEAYIVGIVPVVRPAYSPQIRNGKEQVGRGLVMEIFPLQRRREVTQTEWEWPMTDSQKSHSERAALLRPIVYEMTTPVEASATSSHSGKALSLNISSGGMLILMDQVPAIEQVMKVYVPTPVSAAETPTLAEVRWTRRLPFGTTNGNVAYFVGLKFMF